MADARGYVSAILMTMCIGRRPSIDKRVATIDAPGSPRFFARRLIYRHALELYAAA